MKKILRIFILLIGGLFALANIKTVNASAISSSLTLSKSTVNPGTQFTVSINVSGLTNGMASADYMVSYDSSKFTYVSYSMGQSKPSGDIILNNTNGKVLISYVDSQFGANPIANGTLVNLTFKANSSITSGTSTFSLSGGGYSDKDANSLSGTCIGATIKSYVSSTDNNLTSLSLSSGTLSPSFSSNITNYSATVDSSSVTINAGVPPKGTVTGTGSKTLNYGTNVFQIISKAEAGNTKTYTITITRPDNRSGDATLKSLTPVSGFKSETTLYNVSIPSTQNSYTLNTVPNDSKSKVTYSPSQTIKLNYGEKKSITVTVTAENGTTKTYTVTIVRKNKDGSVEKLSNNTNLKNIMVNNHNINLKENVFVYSISVENNISTLDIKYELEDSKSTAIIEGNQTLNVGNNKIKIIVTAEDGTTKTYEVLIERKELNIEVENNKDSILNAIKNSDNNSIIITVKQDEPNKIIYKEILNELKSSNDTLIYQVLNENDGLNYSITIEGNEINTISNDIDYDLSFESKNNDSINKVYNNKHLILNFNNNSELPAKITLKVFVGNKFANKNELHLYSFNEKTNKLELLKSNLKIENNYVELQLKELSEYVLVDSLIGSEKEINSNNNILKIVTIVFTLVIIIGLIIYIIFNNKIIKKIRTSL